MLLLLFLEVKIYFKEDIIIEDGFSVQKIKYSNYELLNKFEVIIILRENHIDPSDFYIPKKTGTYEINTETKTMRFISSNRQL